MVECNGIAKKYIRVSKNESKKSEETDGRKQLRRQVSQRADDVGWMSNREKRKVSPRKEKNRIGVNRNRDIDLTLIGQDMVVKFPVREVGLKSSGDIFQGRLQVLEDKGVGLGGVADLFV